MQWYAANVEGLWIWAGYLGRKIDSLQKKCPIFFFGKFWKIWFLLFFGGGELLFFCRSCFYFSDDSSEVP